jgi:integrase
LEERLMPAPSSGQLIEYLWRDGETVSYTARVHAYGRREHVTFGTSRHGWNHVRAELELERILQQIDRGVWVPPRLEPPEDRAVTTLSQLGVRTDETFEVFARRWWRSKRLQLEASTAHDYEWRLDYLRRFFGRHRLREIDVELVDRFRDELRERANTIRAAAARGRSLTETFTDRRGRTYTRRRQPLSNTSINAMIKLLGQILQLAVDYELVVRNPVRVGERGQRYLPRLRSVRSFLEVDEFQALLAAARELDTEPGGEIARRVLELRGRGLTITEIARKLDRTTQTVCYHLARPESARHGPRTAIVAALGLAGLRISELRGLRAWQVDVARGRFKLTDAKTEKGIREVEMTLYLRELLAEYTAAIVARGASIGANDPFLGGARGRTCSDKTIRLQLVRSIERANANRTGAGLAELPKITPHSLRRTWATFAALVGRDQNWIADQIGHTSASFTFSVYEQVHRRRYVDEQAVWELMRFADEPAVRPSPRQITRYSNGKLRQMIGQTDDSGDFDDPSDAP